MHRTNTLDYIFIIDGEFELTLDSGEKRIMKRGDACVQRASMHAWKNLSKTEFGRLGAVCIGIEGAKVNEMIFPKKDGE
jgi:quercetin dioxygenase-like cupin family protein